MATMRLGLLLVVASAATCWLLVNGAESNEPYKKVKVAVFFESKCPDSRRFFDKQLLPAYQELNGSDSLQLELVPFGKARTLGQNRMVCQHGASECQGNRLMACILARSGQNQTASLLTVGCLFDWNKTYQECVEEHLPKSISFPDLQRCQDGEESYKLMQELERRTGRITYVPRIEINGKQSDQFQADCETELVKCIKEAQREP